MDYRLLSEYNQLHGEKKQTDQAISDDTKTLYEITALPEPGKIDTEKAWEELEDRIKHAALPAQHKTIFPLMKAAMVVLAIGAVVALHYFSQPSSVPQPSLIAVEAVSDKHPITLPDGSNVWLRKGSSLTYPEAFGDNREVHFTGEAYFDIVKSGKSFVVDGHHADIKVLGTAFNLVSKKAQDVSVYVTEGIVELTNEHGRRQVKRGTQGIYSIRDKQFNINKTPDVNDIAWKTGRFKFENTPLALAAAHLKAYYGSKIQFSESMGSCTVTGTFENLPLGEIVKEIALILSVEAQRQGNSYRLTGRGC